LLFAGGLLSQHINM